MDLEKRINAFIELGKRIYNLPENDLQNWILLAKANNNWFTEVNIRTALQGIIEILKPKNLESWISKYSILNKPPKKVGVVMAGNIPGVGFHDLLCVLISGNILYAKLSSDDSILLKKIADILIDIEPQFKDHIHFVDRLNDMDAVIATGSDNTANYFHYYFSKIPHIIRQNRTSCAILNGEEGAEDLERLGTDILLYFGLGCRNVSKLFLPLQFNFDNFFRSVELKKHLIDNHKYYNNYDYNKSVFLVNQIPHLDNGFLLLRESVDFFSPISVVYYEYYNDLHDVQEKLDIHKDKIQAIVSNINKIPGTIPFGEAQFPSVNDYADGVDTISFLTSIK
ncbi:MAG: acyl-CoA reductase [Cytophagaceae bacterium]|nr:acyl-CoA reductase [Cytophagaceae bacterium]